APRAPAPRAGAGRGAGSWPPAGPTDVFARLTAQKLSEQLGAQFYVENIAGAGGNIGAGRAAQSPPDGYTILVNGANHVVNPALYQHVPYDPTADFDPLTIAVSAPAVLTVNPVLPVQTVGELVALIKANPGKCSFASPGTGTPPHLVGELFRLSLGLDLVHVPFNGGGPAIGSAVAGHTPISFGSVPPAVSLVKDGKLRALAVSSKSRSPALPDTTQHDRSRLSRSGGGIGVCCRRAGRNGQGDHRAPSARDRARHRPAGHARTLGSAGL